MVERIRTPGGSNILFPSGLCTNARGPVHLDLARSRLTLLDSWHNDWDWVAPNILLSFALIRLGRPYAQLLLQRHVWAGFALLASALFALLPVTTQVVDYGAEGWLWALFGLSQRNYVDEQIIYELKRASPSLSTAPHGKKKPGPNETAGMSNRRVRLCVAGTNRILVCSVAVRRLHYRPGHFVTPTMSCSCVVRLASNRQN